MRVRKLRVNGAITLGTMDGANVEIFEQVGRENMFLFGMNVDEVNELWAKGYDPKAFLANDPALAEVISMLTSGVLGARFDSIAASLLTTQFGVADRYMAIADFADYARAQNDVGRVYRDKNKFMEMSLVNIAKAGLFSADRSVMEYANNIWKM